ncbi:MAG: hypothetical protein JSW34_12170 [Candidatus Zixiibacteriota bacterium]|nr:MAG: hypothetical protein JSW34_12170 [candidate division Zixibacteria bacterium]
MNPSRLTRILITAFILLAMVPSPALAGEKDPITGVLFAEWTAAQQTELQNLLGGVLPERDGYLIPGPLDIRAAESSDAGPFYHSLRIVCPDLAAQQEALKALSGDDPGRIIEQEIYLDRVEADEPIGYRGILLKMELGGMPVTIQLSTVQQTRWLIWAKQFFVSQGDTPADSRAVAAYASAVSDYFHQLDRGAGEAAPAAVDFGLPQALDIYAPPPDYVIPGYDNYQNFLHSHNEIKTDFARGITAFMPSDSLLKAIVDNAPAVAFPNKEAPMLQREYRKFYDRQGDVRVMSTLTRAGFDTLAAGEYFFAVGLSGKIRFGRELLRAEVDRLEKETGRKVPRANHAFLFPGEPVLTAGAFFLDEVDGEPVLTEVSAQSGHYFYSNVSPTIKEDISVNSNHYLMTLGHFFKSLNEMEIGYGDVLIRKF